MLMLGLFYSLAFHMHRTLGAWPESIGEAGFPGALMMHAHIAVRFYGLVWFGIFVWPVAIVVSLLRPRWHHWVLYLGVYAGAFFLCLSLMQLAPARFLYWWAD